MMDASWIAQHIVGPVVVSVVGLVTATLIPLLGRRFAKYANRKWSLDIDEREQAKLDAIAVDVVHLVEAQLGPGNGKQKLAQALPALIEQAAAAGIDIGEDVARAKLERALSETGIRDREAGQ